MGDNITAGAVENASWASKFHALRNGLFGTLFVMMKRHSNMPVATVCGMLIKFLQISAFLFISSEFLWRADTIAPVKVLSLIPSPAGWFKIMSSETYHAVYFFSFAWVIGFVSLMGWALRSFLKGEIPHLWPLHLLSSIGNFSATVAYIPLVTVLLSVFMCDDSPEGKFWYGKYECWAGGHLALVIISAVLGSIFIGLAFLFAMVFYDSHPLSSNLATKVHGRADVAMLVIKTVLILTVEIFPRSMGPAWTLVAINLIAGVSWVSVVLAYMPMIHHAMNAFQLALACLYLFGGICLVIAQAAPHVDAAIILYVGAPTAIMAGVGMANFRKSHVMSMSISKMWSHYEVEMRARYTLQTALQTLLDHSLSIAAKIESAGASTPTVVTDPVAVLDDGGSVIGSKVLVSPRGMGSPRTGVSKGRDTKSRRSAMDDSSDIGLLAAAYLSMESEARAGLIREKLPTRTVNEVEALYKSAVIRFPTSAMLHMFQSRFYSTFKDDRHLSTSHLLLANRLNPALDVSFLSFQARRAAENGAGSGVLSSAMHRVSFDKHLADARTSTMKAAQAQVAFWQELGDPKPDINMLHKISTELANHTTWAEDHFKEVFALHPQSLSAMRLFAQYNLSVANNPEKAAAISAEADRIEDQKNREQSSGSGNSNGFILMDETSAETMSDAPACLTVGATSRDLGIMLSANAAACKTLGYTRLQLERRDLSIIVPSPFTESHDSYMRRYLSTGEGQMLETARLALAKHRQGHLVPVAILVRETALPDGTPVFTAMIRPQNFTDHLVMMDGDWVIQGGTAGALLGLGVEPATLASSEVNMADYCPTLTDPEQVDALSAKASGDVITLRLPGMHDGGDGPGNMGISDVKATLTTRSLKGHVLHIMTWRMLSANEAAQRRNSLSVRAASGLKTVGSGAHGSFRMAAAKAASELGPSMGDASDNDDQRSTTGGGAKKSLPVPVRAGSSMNRGVSFHTEDTIIKMGPESGRTGSSYMEDASDGWAADDRGDGMSMINQPYDSRYDDSASDVASVGIYEEGTPARMGAGQGTTEGDKRYDGPRGASERSAQDGPTRQDGIANRASKVPVLRLREGMQPNPLAGIQDSMGLPPGHANLAAAFAGGSCPVVNKSGVMAKRQAHSEDDHGDDEHYSEGSGHSKDKKRVNMRRESSVSQPDGNRSVGKTSSHGSGSRQSSMGRATLNKLRRILADTRGANGSKGVPGLSALYVTGWSLFLLNVLLGVISAVLLDGNFEKYANNLKFASIAGRTTQAQVRAMRLVTQRALYNRGWLASTYDQEMKYSKEMSSMANFYAQSSSSMYELVAGTDRASFFTDPTLEYADFTDIVPEPAGRISNYAIKAMLLGNVYWPRSLSSGQVLVGRRRRTSLLDFSSMWAGMLKQYANLPIENCTNDHPWTLFITTNTQAGAPAHVKIKKAIYESYLASEDSEATVTTLVLWIFVAMGPILASVILLIVIPILLYIDRSRDDIMERFLDLPNLIVAVMRSQAERRLKALRSDDEDVDTDNEEDENDVQQRLGVGNLGDGSLGDVEHDDGTVDWDALFARATVEAVRAEKKKKALAAQAIGGHLTDGVPVAMDASIASTALLSPASAKGQAVVINAAPVAVPRAAVGRRGAFSCCGRKPAAPAASAAARVEKKGLCCTRKEAAKPQMYPGRTFCSRGKAAPGGGYYRSVINPDGTVTTFIRRDFRKSSKSMVSLSAVFLAPVLLMFIFYLVLYLVTMDTLSRVIAMSAFTSLSALRAAALEASIGTLFNQLSQIGYGPEEAFRYEFTAQEVVNLRSINELMVYDLRIATVPSVDNGVAPPMQYKKGAGTESGSVPGMDGRLMGVISDAMLKHACDLIVQTEDGQKDGAACEAFNGAVMTSGLQAGLRDYVNRNRRLRDRRWDAEILPNSTDGKGTRRVATSSDWGQSLTGQTIDNSDNGISTSTGGGTYVTGGATTGSTGKVALASAGLNETIVTYVPYDLRAELTSDDWMLADEMVEKYLAPAFLLIASWYSDAGEKIVVTYRTFLMAYVAAFLTVFSAGIFFLYLPSIGALARDVQSKRAMLLLLPAQVIAKVPSIRALVILIVAEHEGGGSSSSMANAGRSFQEEGQGQGGAGASGEGGNGYASGGEGKAAA